MHDSIDSYSSLRATSSDSKIGNVFFFFLLFANQVECPCACTSPSGQRKWMNCEKSRKKKQIDSVLPPQKPCERSCWTAAKSMDFVFISSIFWVDGVVIIVRSVCASRLSIERLNNWISEWRNAIRIGFRKWGWSVFAWSGFILWLSDFEDHWFFISLNPPSTVTNRLYLQSLW